VIFENHLSALALKQKIGKKNGIFSPEENRQRPYQIKAIPHNKPVGQVSTFLIKASFVTFDITA